MWQVEVSYKSEMAGTFNRGDTIINKHFTFTVKPVLSSHSKRISKIGSKTDYRLLQVKSIAECSKRAFCNTFDLH